ncbi:MULTISPECIES: DUF3558 domain-containing protein [Nocardia]|uniref:DUF3558 domain-containing protein n=1 Tax=Nocardia nova TaxID=37330 RepID=A0A2T2Z4W4_9NOCA|nr:MULTISPECIES: DUF3558 domain-containing protein [Nocardia]PSR62801.1 DUF3558 domain-containing protein [Nocardia nova]
MRSVARVTGVSSLVACIASAAAVAACSATEEAGDSKVSAAPMSTTALAKPTLTASKLQPPSQDTEYTKSSGKPRVVFDPCTWIPDAPFEKLGLTPTTRERGSDIVAEYTFLTCDVKNSDESLQMDSGNITLDEVRQKYAGRTHEITVNGRKAVLTPEKTGDNECSVDIETKAGYFGLTDILSTHGIGTGISPCDRATEMATTLEPYIGKDN